MLKRMHSEQGFTLVDVLVVLAILAILVPIVVLNLTGISGEAKGTAAQTELDTVQTAMDCLMAENNAATVTMRLEVNAATVGPHTEVEYWYVSNIDGDTGEKEYDSATANLRLRTTSNGSYYWDINGVVSQKEYP